jgi:hypothetical protein
MAVRQAADECFIESRCVRDIEHGEVVAEPVHLGELEAHHGAEA